MFDRYYDKLRTLSEEKLIDELTDLQKKLFRVNPTSPVFLQLQQMIEMAQTAMQEKAALNRFKYQQEHSNSIVEIGTVDSVEEIIEYDDDVLLDVMVTFYTEDNNDNEIGDD